MTREFTGYGAGPPHAEWPGDARLAVNFVINFEGARNSPILPVTAFRKAC